jgi:putrescine aminotransferase
MNMSMDRPHRTSTEVLDAFIQRSWRSNAERQRAKGAEFVIGHREGVHMWNLEGTHRVIDCGTGGGVHSLGHRHPTVLAALRKALDDGRDTGLWTVPNQPYLDLQDRLAALAPHPALNRSVVTLASTVSVDVATMFAFRLTGRQRMLAFRHGYHGHSGFAAIVTGSPDEGVIDHYNLPTTLCDFFDHYGDLDELSHKMTPDIAAIILEPMDYETFRFGDSTFFAGLRKLCDERGVLMIIDETRTGIGRTGQLWASSQFAVAPDMMITGKGLSGGLYPVSALLMRQGDYDRCMNEHRFAYISSLGGNEIACCVASAVLDVASDPALLAQGRRVAGHLSNRLAEVSAGSNRMGAVYHLGFALGVEVPDRAFAKTLYAEMLRQGVLCHSICETEPAALKFFPPITMTMTEADDVANRLGGALRVLA